MIELEDAYNRQMQRAHILNYADYVLSDHQREEEIPSANDGIEGLVKVDQLRESLLERAVNTTYYAGVIN